MKMSCNINSLHLYSGGRGGPLFHCYTKLNIATDGPGLILNMGKFCPVCPEKNGTTNAFIIN